MGLAARPAAHPGPPPHAPEAFWALLGPAGGCSCGGLLRPGLTPQTWLVRRLAGGSEGGPNDESAGVFRSSSASGKDVGAALKKQLIEHFQQGRASQAATVPAPSLASELLANDQAVTKVTDAGALLFARGAGTPVALENLVKLLAPETDVGPRPCQAAHASACG